MGIDVRKVVGTNTSPVINTGIANKAIGFESTLNMLSKIKFKSSQRFSFVTITLFEGHSVCARGLLKTPMACFHSAFDAYCAKYNLTATQLLATLQ